MYIMVARTFCFKDYRSRRCKKFIPSYRARISYWNTVRQGDVSYNCYFGTITKYEISPGRDFIDVLEFL